MSEYEKVRAWQYIADNIRINPDYGTAVRFGAADEVNYLPIKSASAGDLTSLLYMQGRLESLGETRLWALTAQAKILDGVTLHIDDTGAVCDTTGQVGSAVTVDHGETLKLANTDSDKADYMHAAGIVKPVTTCDLARLVVALAVAHDLNPDMVELPDCIEACGLLIAGRVDAVTDDGKLYILRLMDEYL